MRRESGAQPQVPNPKREQGEARAAQRSGVVASVTHNPMLDSALPGRHSSPLAPTQAHLLRGPWGRKAVHKQGPPERMQASGGGAAPSTRPACRGGTGVHSAPCPSISKAGARALREPESFQESRQTQRPPVSMPYCSAEHKDTCHLPGSRRAGGGGGDRGLGWHSPKTSG